jgi:putative phage-type endonuclease
MNASAVTKEVQEEFAQLIDVAQGSKEWLALRKTKITSTDASVIMRANPWKTPIQLYNEKLSDALPMEPNERMKRGTDLEPIARDLFYLKTGIEMYPAVFVKEWMMASLDGLSKCGNFILEIKCPGEKDHAVALNGMIPRHYIAQLQHAMYVAGVQMAYYFSFDGIDGMIVEVKRDDDYINKMLIEERMFYECLMDRIPPKSNENEYIERDDALWESVAARWKAVTVKLKEIEIQEDELRKQLIFLSGESNTKGGGISLCQVERKGNVDYSKIPQLKGIDLEPYRKASSNSWRITTA